MSKPQVTFNDVLAHLADESPLNPTLLYKLSMPNKNDLIGFEAIWPTIEDDRRQLIMRSLVEIAEQSFEVYFDPIFIFGLSDSNADIQATAIEGLWENESPALAPVFIQLLKEGITPKVRATAATALGIYIYLGELEEIDDTTQMITEQALLSTIRQSDEDLEVVRRAVEAIAFSSQEGIDQIIENAYYHDDELMQVSAIFAMGRTYNQKWGDIVISELDNPNPKIRFEAVRACGSLELEDALPKLIELIDVEPDTEVIQNAVWSLGQIKGQIAQEKLESLLEAPDEAIRFAAEDALDELVFLPKDMMNIDIDNLFDDDDLETDDDDYRVYYLN